MTFEVRANAPREEETGRVGWDLDPCANLDKTWALVVMVTIGGLSVPYLTQDRGTLENCDLMPSACKCHCGGQAT